ncbi:MAG TPA: hypothetical protein VG826_34940 [Pirellulales bacterium]|nr:hypothetical protein [Pirellulales bacterium]
MSTDIDPELDRLIDATQESFPRRPDAPVSLWLRRAFGEGYLNRTELDALIAFCTTEVPAGSAVEPGDDDALDEPPFALANDKPRLAPWKPEPPERKQQRMLLVGLDCLPGQGDLFAVGGEGAD